MDRLTILELFTRIVDRRSFSGAAADMGLSRSGATTAIKQLEEKLGTRLLQRSTRLVSPTADGRAYYERCTAILADMEDADRAFAGGSVSGLLRIDVNGHFARELILPEMPAFLAQHPALAVHLGDGDRLVDLLREGVDCVIRAGEPADSDMIVRHLGTIAEATCASPTYLATHGTPVSPDELVGHEMVGFVSSRTGRPMPLEFTRAGKTIEVDLPARMQVGNGDTSVAAAKLGFGIVQAPRFRFAGELAAGSLVEILSDFPPTTTPISILYPSNRQLSPRVRVFIDWLVTTIGPKLESF